MCRVAASSIQVLLAVLPTPLRWLHRVDPQPVLPRADLLEQGRVQPAPDFVAVDCLGGPARGHLVGERLALSPELPSQSPVMTADSGRLK